MVFEPIAVVGRGCVLPGALDPDTFWENVAAGRQSLSAVPDGRWRLPHRWAMGTVDDHLDRTWTDTGGYVTGFESRFDPTGFLVAPERILPLDPLYQWVLHGVREALREAGREGPLPRAGLVLGNLAYPTGEGSAFAEHVWLSGQEPAVREALLTGARRTRPDARNRFSSGLPAHFAARALGLGAGAHALDAACASSLYAIKLACDRLHDGTADLMVAGAVNRVDNLFLHVGFCGLSAVSRSSRSRPLSRDADGLLHGEGAGFVALMRLPDALAAGVRILGVVRGVGLSNDGRGSGLLSPVEEGQEQAMRGAYAAAGIAPETVSLVECHATGTPVGDAVEVRSTARVFGARADLPIGSVKSNVGHLLAAAGMSGLLKLLGALRTGVRPATPGAETPLEALAGTPLRVPVEPEPWPGPRRAALSAFGFGGTNAHLIVEAWDGDRPGRSPRARTPGPAPAQREPGPPDPGGDPGTADAPGSGRGAEVAVVAVGVRAGGGSSTDDFRRALLAGERGGPAKAVDVALAGLCFPPLALRSAAPSHLLAFEAAREAVRGVALPRERTMVVVGTGVDPEVARAGARWRVPHWLKGAGAAVDEGLLARARDAFAPAMGAEQVTGSLPNLVSARISSQLDLTGPSFAVSAEEASGLVALRLAVRAIRAGEVGAALVGATDMSCGAVHAAALRELGRDAEPGDAAVVLVLKPLAAAREDGDPVIALLDDARGDGQAGPPDLVVGDGGEAGFDPVSLFGRAHAAAGLLSVAVAATALSHRSVPRSDGPAVARPGLREVEAVVSPLGAPPARVRLRAGDARPWAHGRPPRLYVFSGRDRREVLAALDAGAEGTRGPARLAVVVAGGDGQAGAFAKARTWLTCGGVRPAGVRYRDAPVAGGTAFVYTNGSAAYPGMGDELLRALPSLGETLLARHGEAAAPPADAAGASVLDAIWGATRLATAHTELCRGVLALHPDAAIGYSSGETSALVALGAWQDSAGLYEDTRASGLFSEELTGPLRAVRRAWARAGVRGTRWSSHLVTAPLDRVRRELADEPAVHVLAVNAPGVCVVGGEDRACRAALARLGASDAIPVDYDLAAHAPELAEVREQWWHLHHRPTVPVPGVRFYGAADAEPYTPTAERAAEAITAQGLGTIDFAATVERAWADGVRVFVEQGPRGQCTGWIGRVLGDRDHVAVALDAPHGRGLRQLCLAVAELVVAGVPVRADDLFARLRPAFAAPAHADGPAPGRADDPAPAGTAGRPAVLRVQVQDTPRLPDLPLPPAVLPRPPRLAPVPEPGPGQEPVRAAADGPAGAVRLPATPEPRPADVRGLVTAHSRRVAALHREVLAAQAEAHDRFLRGTARVVAALAGHARDARTAAPSVPLPLPLPLAPPPPPAPPAPPEPPPGPHRPGPRFDRAQLERLASGPVSDLFGPRFAPQDGYAVQTRMPRPPMLLADRVTGIDAEPAALLAPGAAKAVGTIWTETDVGLGSWYLDATGRMPPGLMVEAGQADLLLISWLGVDLLNRGERAYRLLGCEMTFHGSPPRPGETLAYEIHIDGHAEHGGVRLFFFHYDCTVEGELRLSVRGGRAGFFTPAELRDSPGLRQDPAARPPVDGTPLDPPAIRCTRRGFTPDQVRAFAEGRPADCFGPGWEATASHVRTPRVDQGRLRLLHEVTRFDPAGGPWGRGYLRAETPVRPDDWFFDGHFENDPCMPGTLMLQGGMQAMAFYLAAMGYTADRDGWRFEPVAGQPCTADCRGQAVPSSRTVVYEVLVRGVSAGPLPTLHADVVGSVDGVPAFHGRDVAVRLVPDWPLSHWRHLGPPAVHTAARAPALPAGLAGLVGHREDAPVAAVDGFSFGYASLLACAWGRPSDAFGPSYARFDGTRRVARLPGPPYHFMSRVVAVEGPQNGMRRGSRVVAEYDVPDLAWYFAQDGGGAMPFAVLMEVALQPCGWLASYAGSALTTGTDLLFRNLDGTGTVLGEVSPATRTVRTTAELTGVSRTGDMVIESFSVRCQAEGEPVFALTTVFGYFPRSAFERQPGLPVPAGERDRLAAPCDHRVDLTRRPARFFAGSARLPGPMLLMLDRITGYWPDAGRAGLGRLRSEKDVDPGEWFFTAHFFQDPVQPGSLGVEAMCQLLRYYLIERGLTAGPGRARFEPVLQDREVAWKYRGQITPATRLIRVDMEILEVGEDARGRYATAEATLWGDDTCIYRVRGIGVRVVQGAASPAPGGEKTPDGTPAPEEPTAPVLGVPVRRGAAAPPDREPAGGASPGPRSRPGPGKPSRHEAPAAATGTRVSDDVLDPAVDGWIADHCPTWTLPVLPMASVLDRLACAARALTGRGVVAVRGLRLRRWVPLAEPARLRTEAYRTPEGVAVRLLLWRSAPTRGLSRYEEVAAATVSVGAPPTTRPGPFPRLTGAEEQQDPYASGELFHGPAFQYLTSWSVGPSGASAVLDAGRGTVPPGCLRQGLLDAAVQVVPHQSLWRWAPEVGGGRVGFPHRLEALDLYEALPATGTLTAEARFAGFAQEGPSFPVSDIQLSVEGRVAAALRLVSVLLSVPAIATASPADRRAFLARRQPVPGLALSRVRDGATVLTAADVEENDWLRGTVAEAWGLPADVPPRDRLAVIAVKEHVARLAGAHPHAVDVAEDVRRARVGGAGQWYAVHVTRAEDTVAVRSVTRP
ncbi:beta-ketoacyl synthase N-terminal-like domain-containing protein [Streptomyces sp. NPDC047002]|uniref:beta-ketoacyl synthase N-terminal-like domain-containing protein n=1 Tax=Streptomyces sp. NPDC047002 TaxID=3155475 RepID=UPI003454FC47